MKYLDTSIILETILKNAFHRKKCGPIMKAVKQGKENVIISTLNISELFHILEDREHLTLDYVNDYLEKLTTFAGIHIREFPPASLPTAFQLSKKYTIDLTDACTVVLMREHSVKEIYALDRHYDDFPDIQRLTELKLDFVKQ